MAAFHALCCIKAIYPYNMFAILWLAGGVLWFWAKLGRDAHKFNSDRWTEFMMALQIWDNCLATLYLWPMDMIFCLCNWGPCSSFRGILEDEIYRETMATIAPTSGRDNAIFEWRHSCAASIKETKLFSKRTKQIPQELVVNSKASYACGATAITLVTAPTLAAQGNTTNRSVEVSSYGWVTGVAKFPTEGKELNELRHARLRTTFTVSALKLGLFTEIDGAQLQVPYQDWCKQYFLFRKFGDSLTVNVGRMAVSPIYMTPPPFLLETVNFPRTPWSVFAHAIEADAKIGPMRVIADISGKSGLHFDDPGQFSRIEGSARIQYALKKQYTVSVTGQASEDFARYSLDFVAKPVQWLDVKGACYQAHNGLQTRATVTQGAFGYVGTRPFSKCKGLELHGQVDYQDTLGRPPKSPFIWTGGARLLMKDGKYSATADYQEVPGFGTTSSSGALFVRLQVRF